MGEGVVSGVDIKNCPFDSCLEITVVSVPLHPVETARDFSPPGRPNLIIFYIQTG